MEKLKIENLTFTYPKCTAPALDDVTLAINTGDFTVICGKSGCGKSTLLRQLKPILTPHGTADGKILFDGADIREMTQRQQASRIGFVGQNPDNGIVCDKVWHELAFGLESLGYSNAEIRSRTAEMAAFFGIEDWFHKKVTELSGGQKQLLNLAAAMLTQPSVLILDEPTSQLDPIAAKEFLEMLRRVNREFGTTVVLSEHRLEDALPLADKVAVMEKGRIIAEGSPRAAGSMLKEIGSDIIYAFPVPMRVYYAAEDGGECPVTVREGKAWLAQKELLPQTGETAEFVPEVPAAEVKEAWFRYEKNSPDVLKGLSLTVHEGECYAIMGGNGAGKTTALSLISGINRPYRGKVKIAQGKKIAALPQNPECLFSRKTVMLNLLDAAEKSGFGAEDRAAAAEQMLQFSGIGELAEKHPYDLSGGEQQRAALAMVLLAKPDILILDEPTKGIDVHFKMQLAKILSGLKKSGAAVIMVSHDIEFCAKYADRCGLLFDGVIVSEDTPRSFFSGKTFYTTAANRMARDFLPDAVLAEDITAALGIEHEEKHDTEYKKLPEFTHCEQKNEKKKITAADVLLGIVFAAAFVISSWYFMQTDSIAAEGASIIFLLAACTRLIPRREFGIKEVQTKKDKRHFSKRTAAAAAAALFLIPLTIFVGIYYLDDRKYYFISLLIILESMLPFALIFEGRKPQARELVIISTLCAIAVAGRTAFAPLPQFKPVTAIVIISGVCFGGETGFAVGAVTGFVSNFFFGQGPWTPWQMFSFGIIGFLAGVLFKKGLLRKTRLELCIFGFFAVLVIYGGIMNPASVLMGQAYPTWTLIKSSYVLGLPFDMIHALSTVFFLWIVAEPMCEKLDRVKVRYGLLE